jgi:hypothetical protein
MAERPLPRDVVLDVPDTSVSVTKKFLWRLSSTIEGFVDPRLLGEPALAGVSSAVLDPPLIHMR